MARRPAKGLAGPDASALVTVRGDAQLPWSDAAALCFHTMTTLRHLNSGRAEFEALRASGASLLPPRRRRAKAGDIVGSGGAMLHEDRVAGDDRFTFFAVGMPYEGSLEPSRPTLAYDLRSLLPAGRVGWRPHDLYSNYKRFGARGARAFAEKHTVWDPETVASILALVAARLRGGAAAFPQAWAELRSLVGKVHEPLCNRPYPCFGLGLTLVGDGFEEVPDEWPRNLAMRCGAEVVVEGRVPLADAAWIWDGVGPWRRGGTSAT